MSWRENKYEGTRTEHKEQARHRRSNEERAVTFYYDEDEKYAPIVLVPVDDADFEDW